MTYGSYRATFLEFMRRGTQRALHTPEVQLAITYRSAETMINTKKVLRHLLTLAVAGLGLAVAPGTAYADFLDFTVVESTVPGSPLGPTFVADDLNGKYRETLTLTPSAGPCAPGQLACGTFSATALATFGQYF